MSIGSYGFKMRDTAEAIKDIRDIYVQLVPTVSTSAD